MPPEPSSQQTAQAWGCRRASCARCCLLGETVSACPTLRVATQQADTQRLHALSALLRL
eukprot:COSAG05_NODE_959_length_6425_cov_4.388397_3_plen_59_part_00